MDPLNPTISGQSAQSWLQSEMGTRQKRVIRFGLIAGIVLLYVGVIGMLESFNEREVVEDTFTLAQLLIVVIPFVAGYVIVQRNRKAGATWVESLAAGAAVGALTVVPSLLMLIYHVHIDEVDSVLVNVNNRWIDVITFDYRRDLLTGALTLALVTTLAGITGAVIRLLPTKVSRALIAGFSVTLTVGVFGETMRLILQENLTRDTLDELFARGTMKQNAALGLLALSLIGSFLWSYFGTSAGQSYQKSSQQTRQVMQLLFALFVIGFLLLLPQLIGRSLSEAATTIGIYVLMGFGLNIAIGLAGLLDLGYVTNYAVGAYVMAVLTSTGPLGRLDGMTFWLVIPVALLSAMITGFIFAVPVLKMRGDYLAIATLGFGEIIGKLAVSDWLSPLIGGAQGISFIPKPLLFETEIKNPEQFYYLVLAACVVTLFISIRLNNSRTGRQWMAIREDEDVAAAMGINVARSKLLAFTLSAATGGVAGAIFAAKVGAVYPNSFTVFVSINVLSLIIVGGMGSNPGIVIGAIVLVGMPELLREFSDYRWLLYGALLIFMMVNRPEGLIPSQVRQRELHKPTTEPESSTVIVNEPQPRTGEA